MIKKLTNKDERFYNYMGKIFGSRKIQRQTNDRMYDDDEKIWYVYIEKEEVLSFVSVQKKIIKNVYTTKNEYLEEILNKVRNEIQIEQSVVSKNYQDIYIKCGFRIYENQEYKNFVIIY